jgi:hypothetical protein
MVKNTNNRTAERTPAYADVAADDPHAAMLAEYISGLHEPIYVDNPPKIEIDDLPDFMPAVYA